MSAIPGGIFDPDAIRTQIADKEAATGDPVFWNDRERAEATMTEIKRLRDLIEPWETLITDIEDTEALLELALDEGDDSQEEEIRRALQEQRSRYEKLQLKQLLRDEVDGADAFLTIHSGAGGTEACDWVSMLYRMYRRWTDAHGYQSEVIDLLEAEGGIKSVTIEVKGPYAFGYLKAEAGIHQLVRISPFDSSGRRHTSFASVYVSPVIDDSIDVDLKMEEVRVDTYRASGAGGQHVNKTDSAGRMTHIPTNIVVQSVVVNKEVTHITQLFDESDAWFPVKGSGKRPACSSIPLDQCGGSAPGVPRKPCAVSRCEGQTV